MASATETHPLKQTTQTVLLTKVEFLVIRLYYDLASTVGKTLVDSLKDEDRFRAFIGPRIENDILKKKRVTFRVDATLSEPTPVEILDRTLVSGALTFRLSIDSLGLSVGEFRDLSRRVTKWVEHLTFTTEDDRKVWQAEQYSVVILWKTSPMLQSKADLAKSPSLVARLSSLQSPLAKFYDQKFTERLLSGDVGFLSYDFYLLRRNSALIFNPKFPEAQDYILGKFMDCIIQLRLSRSLLVAVNNQLDERVKKSKDLSRTARKLDLDLEISQLGEFRKSALDALTRIYEQSGKFDHLKWTVKRCQREFGLDSLKAQIEDKIGYLNLAYQSLIEARERRFQRNIQIIAVIIAAIGAVLALLAIPGVGNWLVTMIQSAGEYFKTHLNPP